MFTSYTLTRSAVASLAVALLASGPFAAAAADSPPPPEPTAAEKKLAPARQAIDAKDWPRAIALLEELRDREPKNADVHNLLGFSERKRGNLDAAFAHYEKALALDPKHRGAHEYVGEAYLMAGNLAKAEEHLKALDKLCPFSCEEYRDLKKEIAEYKKKAAPQGRGDQRP
jgi:Flp pilus assembly protein TadD